MNHDVAQTHSELLDEFQVQPDTSRLDIAGPPARFHSLDALLWRGYPILP